MSSMCLLVSGAAVAQTPPAGQSANTGTELQELVVTARKRSETAQKTPLAITALSAESLAKQQITQVSDLQNSVAGFEVTSGAGDSFNNLISLRGISTQQLAQNVDPTVGIYIDGIYQGFSGANLKNSDDVARIEVVKGPQGTLYGRNSTGGAVNIIHNLPIDDYEGWLKFGIGNYSDHEVSALVNVPIIPEKMQLRLLGGYTEHDGYGHDVGVDRNSGRPYGDLQQANVLATLRFVPTDDLEIIARGSYEKGRSDGLPVRPTYMLLGSTANYEVAAELFPNLPVAAAFFGTPNAAVTAALPVARAAYLAQAQSNFYNSIADAAQIDTASKFIASITATYTINDQLSLKSITAAVRAARLTDEDQDGSIFALQQSLQDTVENQITQEFQFNGVGIDDKLRYTAGFYYYSKTAKDDQGGDFFGDLLMVKARYDVRARAESFAPYGQATYALTPDINFTVGLRWTNETKNIESNDYESLLGSPYKCIIPGIAAGAPCHSLAESSFHSTSYLFELDYSPMPDLLTYVKSSRAFRSGGVQETAPGFPAFGPETLTDYEIGVKSEFFERRLRVNADIYHEDYNDLQQNVTVSSGGALTEYIANAGRATVDGVELQVAGSPLEGLTLALQGAYTFPKYLTFIDPIQGQLAGAPFTNVARWAYTLGADYTIPVEEGSLNFHLDYHWQSTINLSATPTISMQTLGTVSGINGQGAYGLLNGRVAYQWEPHDLEIAVYGRNLTDQRYFSYTEDYSGNRFSPGNGIAEGNVGAPRTFGVQFTKRF
jgi:iron complex outermembrane receptor protein